jgi:hypothetical protein
MGSPQKHDATAVAIAFRYQERRALFDLWETQDDDAAVAVEALDDIQLNLPGQTLIEQVKHSVQAVPPPITTSTLSLWKTLRIWCELLPKIDIANCRFVFVCTSPIEQSSSLNCLKVFGSDITVLLDDLDNEAERVRSEAAAAALSNKSIPHKEKTPGVTAWLKLPQKNKRALLERVVIKSDSPNIDEQEDELAASLKSYPKAHRKKLASALFNWWDGEVLHSMQQKREKFIGYFEVTAQLSHLNAMLQNDQFFETFSSAQPPPIFGTDERLAKQCNLINATNTRIDRARTLEWQARSQRAVWADESPLKNSLLVNYDKTLEIEWKAHHDEAIELSNNGDKDTMISEGIKVFNWALECNSTEVGNIGNYSTPPFYIRGSYQTLSIDGRVGWHPQYRSLLGYV